MAETSELAENHARSVRGRSEELKSEADGARAVRGWESVLQMSVWTITGDSSELITENPHP